MVRLDRSDVHFSPASPADQLAGLLGYVRVDLGDFLLDGLTLRKTRQGEVRLSFPARKDQHGRRHPHVRDLGGFEAAILGALGLDLHRPGLAREGAQEEP